MDKPVGAGVWGLKSLSPDLAVTLELVNIICLVAATFRSVILID